MDDANEHVAAAANAGGEALPGALMRKFEASLGTDLSSVRVHTGSASQTAAHAVGAKAYTTGSSIHFGAGHYDPSSKGGEELLAHEVAHTVQQRGAAPIRQNKLEVSSPGDHAESEADRAAEAMVSGASFSVGGGASGLHRNPDPNVITLPEQEITLPDTGPVDTDKMNANADAGAKKAAEKAQSGGPTVFGAVGDRTVENKAAADGIVKDIQGAAPRLETGITAGTVESSVRAANATALGALAQYSDTQSTDKFNNDSFQSQAQALGADFVRLQAQLLTFDKSGQGGGAVSDVMKGGAPAGEQRGKRIGDTTIDAASGQDAATMNKGFKQTMTAGDKDQGHSSNATAQWKNAQDCEKDMKAAAQAVSEGTREILPAQATAASAVANIAAIAAGADAGKYQGEVDKLKADGAAAEEKIKLAGSTIKNVVSLVGDATDAKGPNVAKIIGTAVDLVTNIAAYTAKHWNDDAADDAAAKAKTAKANEVFERGKQAAQSAKAALLSLQNAAAKLYDNQTKLADAKTKYRDAMRLMGNSMDKAQGGNAYSVVAQVLSEAETYLVQSKLTLETGKNAIGKLSGAQGGQAHQLENAPATKGQLTYYVAGTTPVKENIIAQIGTFTLKGSLATDNDPGGNALNAVVDKLEVEREEIEGIASRLRAVYKA